jgi:hypothetical protein
MLFDNSKAASLRCDSQQDALDFASNCVKNSKGCFSFNTLDFCESYRSEEAEVCIELRSRTEGNQYHLMFRVIPDVRPWNHEVSSAFDVHASINSSGSERYQERVLVSVGYTVQCEQNFIPSVVWLERAKERVHFLRNVGASPFEAIFESVSGSSERKVGILGLGTSTRNGDGAGCMIQSFAEVADCIARHLGNSLRKGFRESNFVDGESGILRVRLDKLYEGCILNESLDCPFEVGDVFLSPCDLAPGAFEGIGHETKFYLPKDRQVPQLWIQT